MVPKFLNQTIYFTDQPISKKLFDSASWYSLLCWNINFKIYLELLSRKWRSVSAEVTSLIFIILMRIAFMALFTLSWWRFLSYRNNCNLISSNKIHWQHISQQKLKCFINSCFVCFVFLLLHTNFQLLNLILKYSFIAI